MKYQLFIDTSAIQKVIVSFIAADGTVHEQRTDSQAVKSQTLLPTLEAMMKEHQIPWSDVTEINVATGPGSFTGLRVGASVAVTLSWLLSLPINGKSPGTIPDLAYGESKWKTLFSLK